MADDTDANMGFVMGNKQRERVVQVLGSKGKIPADKVAKFAHIPAPTAAKILAEMGEKKLVMQDEGGWSLTEAGQDMEKEIKKRG